MNRTNILIITLLLSSTLFLVFLPQSMDDKRNKFQQHKITFQNWKNFNSIVFTEIEEKYRLFVFIQNQQKIDLHNSNKERTYDLGLNHFAHLTQPQFQSLFLGIRQQSSNHIISNKQFSFDSDQILTDVDWQVLGKVTDVKNQGSCDAGYAFSATGLVETSLMMQNQNVVLSQQHIIDCAGNFTTYGCHGGSRLGTLNFSRSNGLTTQKLYPYNGTAGTCKKQEGTYKISFNILQSKGCDEIKDNLYKSPMTVAVNANTWQLYKAGIFGNCPDVPEVNHDIYLVGVTLTNWRLKNSWGVRWGEYGYIRLKLGNTCGICLNPAYGFIL